MTMRAENGDPVWGIGEDPKGANAAGTVGSLGRPNGKKKAGTAGGCRAGGEIGERASDATTPTRSGLAGFGEFDARDLATCGSAELVEASTLAELAGARERRLRNKASAGPEARPSGGAGLAGAALRLGSLTAGVANARTLRFFTTDGSLCFFFAASRSASALFEST